MLYGLGIILLLVSAAFVGGSIAIPLAIAGTGIVLMNLERRATNGKKNTAR